MAHTTESDEMASTGMIPRIDPNAIYIMGPVHAQQDASVDTSSGELPAFLQVTEGGYTYPREHAGSYFTKQLQIKTWEAFLHENPEGLKSGRRWFILRKDGNGGYTTVYTGTMLRPQPAVKPQGPAAADGLSDGMTPPRMVSQPMSTTTTDNGSRGTAPRHMIEEMMESLRHDLRAERERSDRLTQQMSDQTTRLVEAERLRITAEAQLEMERKRHESEVEHLRESHRREIEQIQASHERERDVIAAEAANEAQRLADEKTKALLADADEPKQPFLMQALNDYGDIIQPLLGEGLTMAMDYFKRRRDQAAQNSVQAPPTFGQAPHGAAYQPGGAAYPQGVYPPAHQQGGNHDSTARAASAPAWPPPGAPSQTPQPGTAVPLATPIVNGTYAGLQP
jgi:hypothetical protein